MDNRKDMARRELARRELESRQESGAQDNSVSNDNNGKVDTFLGQMNKPDFKQMNNPEMIDKLIRAFGSAPGMGAKSIVDVSRNIPQIGNQLMQNYPKIAAMMKGVENPLKSGLMGAANDPEHPVMGGIMGGALGVAPMALNAMKGLVGTVRNAFTRINPREVAESVQGSHDELLKSAEDIFENVGETAKNRGADIVKVDEKLINKSIPYLAKTEAVEKFLDKARAGSYSALRKLQTDLFHKATMADKSSKLEDKLKAEEMTELRDKINESISKHFRSNGHEDLANNLDEARSLYRNLKQTYYNKKLPMAVRDLVHPDVRKMPKNVMNTFSEESKPMARLIKQNPLVAERLEQHIARKNAIKKLKYLIPAAATVGTVGTLGGIGYAGKKGYDYLTSE